MGVTGLWKLIEPCGKPVPVETLEGKIIAIDISIWLHQVVKGFQDNKGSALNNAHLLGLFNRLCKLLYYRVRPVFVFDGCVPQLKRDTIARRQQQRSKLNTEADRIQALLLQSLAKEKVVQQALGASQAELLLKSPVKRLGKGSRSENALDELFKLPELPVSSTGLGALKITDTDNCNEESDYDEASYTSCTSDDYTLTSTDDSSFEQRNPRHTYNTNLQTIDVRSQHFRNLPADVRHEILVDIKETRKQSSWGRLHELPPRSDDFSSFQMQRLLKRRAVQESLEEAEQEMGGRTLTYNELNKLFTEEGIVEPTAIEKSSKQIYSDENTRFLLVRDLKKKMADVTQEEENNSSKLSKFDEIKKSPVEMQPSELMSNKEYSPGKQDGNCESLNDEYAADLELAIARSLEDSATHVYTEEDFQYDSSDDLKLNREQRKNLKNSAIGPARAYMIEYGCMNDTEVGEILENTQIESNDSEEHHFHKVMDESYKVDNISSVQGDSQTKHDDDESTSNIILHVSEESETDSDLEEVTETVYSSNTIEICQKKPTLEIVLDIEKPLAASDDIFADIFEPEKIDASHKQNIESKREESCFEVIDDKVEDIKYDKDIPVTKIEIPKADASDEKKENITATTAAECSLKASHILSILDEVKKQVVDVKKITLEDINLIEISDEETTALATITQVTPTKNELKPEVIEICDSDDAANNRMSSATPPSKSPKLKTPSKNKKISEYFGTNYVIKRTPEKDVAEEDEQVPKVKSPFFVKKTPTSNRKRTSDNSVEHSQKSSKAAKSLFSSYVTNDEEKIETGTNTENEPRKEKPPPLSEMDVINEAAQLLKDQKSNEELQTLATDLAKERQDLEGERNRQDRMGTSISKRMNADCQELLRLFGIPYIVAPTEAEAQCAFLDAAGLTNGTITDDSDIWLFGGRTVYKNFFAQNKHVLEFRAERIENSFNCDRKKLIQLACLVGSDYTTGVNGVGAVTALEILASFSPPKESKSADGNGQNTISAAITTLCKFRDWWEVHKTTTMPPGSSTRLALHKKLKNINLHDGFPNIAVLEAYMTPKVDECRDTFSWGSPDLESIREFTKKAFGWTRVKTDDTLMPVMKKINEKKTQLTIHKYFSTKSCDRVRELKVSKRVQKAIEKMSGKIEAETPEKPKTKRATKRKQPAVTKTKGDLKNLNRQSKNIYECSRLSLEASTSTSAPSK